MVFTSNPDPPDESETDFESTSSEFLNFPTGGFLNTNPLFNHTAGGTQSELLNGGNNGQVGVAKSFAVFPGDKVKIEAYAKYEGSNSSNAGAFSVALLSAFGLPSPSLGETGTPSAGLDVWGDFVDAGLQGGSSAAPMAHVNILVFDREWNFRISWTPPMSRSTTTPNR